MGLLELSLIAAVIVLLFGGSQLPKLARAIGRAKADFNDGVATRDAASKPPE
jgi:TatA/E family protein of Tat protein translocase